MSARREADGSPKRTSTDFLICPSAVSADGCWDVHSTADLTHNGGGDASGIIAMVNYVLQNKNGDSSRVYVAGHSSGGMMTNVLLGSYPDVFKAGAAFAGVAFGCFAVGSVDSLGWNASCATGNVTETGAQWGDMVRAASPAFTGVRPRIQLWHGTLDATVNFHNFGEEIKEWTNVLGVSATPTSTENNSIQPTWVRTRYTDGSGVVQVEAVQETGQPHNLVVDQAEAIRFFGLDGTAVGPDGGASDGSADARVGADDSGGGTGTSGSTTGSADGGGGATSGAASGSGASADAGQPSDAAAPTMGGGSGSAGSGAGAGSGLSGSGTASSANGASGGSNGQGSGAAGGCSMTNAPGTALASWPLSLLMVAGWCRWAWRRRDRR